MLAQKYVSCPLSKYKYLNTYKCQINWDSIYKPTAENGCKSQLTQNSLSVDNEATWLSDIRVGPFHMLRQHNFGLFLTHPPI